MKKKLAALALALATASGTASACTMESHTNFCVETGDFAGGTYQAYVDGKPSNDFELKVVGGRYMKISYLKPITQDLSGYVLVTEKNGRTFERPFNVSTKRLYDGGDIPGKMLGLINLLKSPR